MKRSTRTILAQQTVEIVERGSYTLADRREVSIRPLVEECLNGTRYFSPEALRQSRDEAIARPHLEHPPRLEVVNETTLVGIGRFLEEFPSTPVVALNFASARNPGGGFLKGSQAQEESLARSSALHASLLRAPEYYERHRNSTSCLYSDSMILSPACPIFRDDEGELLEQPILATFITSAAPNAGAVASNEPEKVSEIPRVLRQRAEYVLALAAWHGDRSIVLGAWGCGVFRNDPEMVARIFAELLYGESKWSTRFERIRFSVLDTSPSQETFRSFQSAFGAA